jgi:cytochrome c peroxidase
MAALKHYDKSQVVMKANAQLRPELDFIIWQDTREMARFRGKLDIEPSTLSEQQIAALIEFLHALKDKKSLKGTYGVPSTVPSNLSLDR